jgi:hypothetical protein
VSGSGRDGACRQLAGEFGALAQKQHVSPLAQAMAYSAGGEVDAAFRKLDEAVQERSTWLPVIRFLPAFQLLRQDPRFTGLLARMNLA